jgi:hypothetical protein
VAAVTLLVFFVLWAAIAAKPWANAARRQGRDPRLVALDRRQRRLTREAQAVKRTLDRRWRDYRRQLRQREARIRTLERRHAEQLAAARVAGATSTYRPVGGGAPAAAPAARVVALPPQVKIVNVPPAAAPATSSGSSHP